jgi:2-dehydro-3-deoxyphosphooctonate aldolase (KDO 8-P synthase)
MNKTVKTGNILIGGDNPPVIIAGPCVIEDEKTTIFIARYLKELSQKLGIPIIFKASYDKANRTSISSYRGPGIDAGLKVLERIRKELGLAILSDVHTVDEIKKAAGVLDIIQIPAFLCRQTDFILKIAETGKPVNIKKGQFLAPWDIGNVVEKIASTGNENILITERGTMFGYNNLVVDFRSIQIMKDTGWPVIFDATHSIQLPGGAGKSSGGDRKFAPVLAKAAIAAGADGVFMEVHPDPDKALCDGPNSLNLEILYDLIQRLMAVRKAVS